MQIIKERIIKTTSEKYKIEKTIGKTDFSEDGPAIKKCNILKYN
jgi:hypothetical protein